MRRRSSTVASTAAAAAIALALVALLAHDATAKRKKAKHAQKQEQTQSNPSATIKQTVNSQTTPSKPTPAATATPAATLAAPAAATADLVPHRALDATHATPPGTRCSACHTVDGWQQVRFAHERTGFVLEGAHAKVDCRACHPSGFARAVPDRCAGCHRDAHAEEFGLHCEGCHDARSWQTQFSADAHRKTNFPLVGRHALIPCVECHPAVRDRVFSRGVVECAGCHLADYNRTASSGLNHVTAGFSQQCQQCHNTWSFPIATLPGHDRCFSIDRGPHNGLRCFQCHTSLTNATVTGACMTNTAACTNCHEHTCARSDARHQGVPGYQCKDRKCYECHRF